MAQRTTKTIIAAEGDGWQVTFKRFDGYSLFVGGEYRGSFDRLIDALEARDELVRRQIMAGVA